MAEYKRTYLKKLTRQYISSFGSDDPIVVAEQGHVHFLFIFSSVIHSMHITQSWHWIHRKELSLAQ